MQEYCILLFCNVYTSDIWIGHPALEGIPCRWLLGSSVSPGTRVNTKSKKAEAVRQFSEKHKKFMVEIDLRNYSMEGTGKQEVLRTLYGLKITMPIKVVFCLASDTSVCDPFQMWLTQQHIPYGTLTKKEIQWLFCPNEKEAWGHLPTIQRPHGSSTIPKSRKNRKKDQRRVIHSLKMENGNITSGPSVKEMSSSSKKNSCSGPAPQKQDAVNENMAENGLIFDFINQTDEKEMSSLSREEENDFPESLSEEQVAPGKNPIPDFNGELRKEESCNSPETTKEPEDNPEQKNTADKGEDLFEELIQGQSSFQEEDHTSVPEIEESPLPESKEIISSEMEQKPSLKNFFFNKIGKLFSSASHPASCTKEEEAERLEREKQQEIKKEQARKTQTYLESLIKRGEEEFARAKDEYLFYAWQSFKILVYVNLTVGREDFVFTDDVFYFIWLSLLQARREEDFETKIYGKPYTINKGSFYKLKRDASALYRSRTCLDAGRRFRPPKGARVISLPTLEKGETGVKERLMALHFSASELEHAKKTLLFWVAATMYTKIDMETGTVFTRQWLQEKDGLPQYTDYLKDDQYLKILYQEILKAENAKDYEISLRVGYQIKMNVLEKTFSSLKQVAEETARIQRVLTAAQRADKQKEVSDNEKKGKEKT